MLQRNEELYDAYIQKSEDLNQVYATLSNLNTRLNAMIAIKFMDVLEKHRLLALSEAFHKILIKAEHK